MVSKKIVIISVVLITILVVVIGILFMFNIIELPRPAATLIVDSGTVQIKHGSGLWENAANGMELKTNDHVKTLENSKASIIFFDSNIMRLDQNSEVSISSLVRQTSVSFEQSAGNTWSKISKASGVEEYAVSTPTTVATVRGTGFAIKVLGKNTSVLVGSGKVNVSSYLENKTLNSTEVSENESTTVSEDNLTVLDVKKITVPDPWLDENKIKDEKFVKEKAQELIKRHKAILDIAKSQYGVTDEQITFYAEGYIRGDFTIQDAIDQGLISEKDIALIPADLKRGYKP